MSEIVLPTLDEMAVLKHQMEIISATYSEKLKQAEIDAIACRARIEQLETELRASRALALEEAAKVAADYQHPNMALYNHQTGISAAILALLSSEEK